MTNKEQNQIIKHTYLWNIDKFPEKCHFQQIHSPEFTLKGTHWQIKLFPQTMHSKNGIITQHVSLYIICHGPIFPHVDWRLCIFNKSDENNSITHKTSSYDFSTDLNKNSSSRGYKLCPLKRLMNNRNDFLPSNLLSVLVTLSLKTDQIDSLRKEPKNSKRNGKTNDLVGGNLPKQEISTLNEFSKFSPVLKILNLQSDKTLLKLKIFNQSVIRSIAAFFKTGNLPIFIDYSSAKSKRIPNDSQMEMNQSKNESIDDPKRSKEWNDKIVLLKKELGRKKRYLQLHRSHKRPKFDFVDSNQNEQVFPSDLAKSFVEISSLDQLNLKNSPKNELFELKKCKNNRNGLKCTKNDGKGDFLGEISLESLEVDFLLDIYKAADFLLCRELTEKCEMEIAKRINLTNAAKIVRFGLKVNLELNAKKEKPQKWNLSEIVTEFLLVNMEEAVGRNEFKRLMGESPEFVSSLMKVAMERRQNKSGTVEILHSAD